MDELTVSYKGKTVQLNLLTLIQHGISGDDKKIDSLLYYHFLRLVEVDLMQRCEVTNTDRLKQHSFMLREFDYKLQNIWGFDSDERYHRFWEQPHCICPNGEDRLGVTGWIINTSCPVHRTD